MRSLSFLFISVFILLTACNNAGDPDNTMGDRDTARNNNHNAEQSIRENVSAIQDAFKRGDSAALSSFYTSDALLMPPNGEEVRGGNISNAWGGFFRMGIKDLKLNTTDLTGSGDLYSETGNYEIFGDNNQSVDKGKYLVVWKNENGNWKMYRDIWNSNLDASPAR
ncbi:MAG: YybH family protein [Chitinophagaceae bacterium]